MATSGDGQTKLLGSLSGVLQRGAERAGFTIEGNLEGVLQRLKGGEVQALVDLPRELRAAVGEELASVIGREYKVKGHVKQALADFRKGNYGAAIVSLEHAFLEMYGGPGIVSPGAALYGSAFFARPRGEVSKDLCGSVLVYAPSVSGVMAGVVTHTAAYKASDKDRHVAAAEPGTIGVWTAQGNDVLIISAHQPDGEGTVAVWGMGTSTGQLGMGAVGETLDIRYYDGQIIGRDAPLQVMPRNPAVNKVGNLTVGKEANTKGATDVYQLNM